MASRTRLPAVARLLTIWGTAGGEPANFVSYGPPLTAKFAKMMRRERLFVAAEGTLLAGTDPTAIGGTLPGLATARPIERRLEAGFPFEQAIQIATLNGARFLGRDQEIGGVAAGKRADLVLLDGDPIDSVRSAVRLH